MRNSLRVTVLTAAVVPLLAGGSVALADPANRTIKLTCESGTFIGITTGSALHIQGGGIAVSQGITDATTGNVLVKATPGLERGKKLVRCTYNSPETNAPRIAFVLFP